MGIRESYENGVFSWVDLVTINIQEAKEFYAKLFNWDFQDVLVEGIQSYSMAYKGDRSVAGIFAMSEKIKGQNIPPHWQSYINVKDLEATVKSWQNHSGTVLEAPSDVMQFGRMAVVKDPTDAIVGLWQGKKHIGAGVVNEVNTFCWAELQTRGSEKAVDFYQKIFNWEIEIEEKPPHYVICKVKDRNNCGIFDMDKVNLPANIPSNWAVYFHVENLDTSIEIVKSLGGKVLMNPIEINPGRFTTISDPQGAVLTIIELKEVDD